MDNRRATISMALIALIGFFLPWVQLTLWHTQKEGSAGLISHVKDIVAFG